MSLSPNPNSEPPPDDEPLHTSPKSSSLEDPTIWKALLEPLRLYLTGKDTWGKRGSLRWLEAAMTARGGRAGSVRNILYKGLGSIEEKGRFFELLCELYKDVGLSAPPLPEELVLGQAKRVLGRDKRQILARFVKELSQGETPQLVVVGGPATGKGVLLEQVHETLPDALMINLAQELAPTLFNLAHSLALPEAYEAGLAKLSVMQPYALQAAAQAELRTLFQKGLNAHGTPLLLRVEQHGTLAGTPLRYHDGSEISLVTWLEPLLDNLTVPFLATCSSAPNHLTFQRLHPPNRDDARRYLHQRLPETSLERLDELLNQAGNSYGDLSRLVLLELSRHYSGSHSDLRVQQDPKLGRLLAVLSALSPEADTAFPVTLLEKVLERPLNQLSPPEQVLVEHIPQNSQSLAMIRPALRELLPEDKNNDAIHTTALDYYRQHPPPPTNTSLPTSYPLDTTLYTFRLIHHAYGAKAYTTLLTWLEADPSQLTLVPNIWLEARTWPQPLQERLALLVLRYRAVLGDYRHPEVQEALSCLMSASDVHLSRWARVKMAEARVDEGQFAHAAELMANLPELSGEAQAEALLVKAALARWQGEYAHAETFVSQALDMDVPPLLADRVHLWQGLVAKDAGRSGEALDSLGKVRNNPLLKGRARYQEGDLFMRLGNSQEGVQAIEEGLSLLQDTSSAEELARVRARLGTLLRRLGRFDEAERCFDEALAQAPDDFTKARVLSEASMLASARGRAWEALRLVGKAETIFRTMQERHEEREYRYDRTLYRLAVAYWVRASGVPYCAPYRGSSTEVASHAKTILRPLIATLEPRRQISNRFNALYLDSQVTLALLLPPRMALRTLKPLLNFTNPFLRLQGQLAYAEALLRTEDPTQAAGQLASIRTIPTDPSITAWKAALDAEMLLCLGQADAACEVIQEALSLPAPFRQQLGRVWGTVLEERSYTELANHWLSLSGPLGLPESLALAFEMYDPVS